MKIKLHETNWEDPLKNGECTHCIIIDGEETIAISLNTKKITTPKEEK